MVATASTTRSREELWAAGSRYLAGTDEAGATARATALARDGFACNIGWLAPTAGDARTAEANTARYARLAAALADLPDTTWLEADAPHLGADLSTGLCVRNLRTVAERLPRGRLLQVGAEDASRTDAVLGAVLAAHREGLPVRATVQANLRRGEEDVDRLSAAGVPVRLVKGGFAETPELALQGPDEIDAAYLRLARRLARSAAPPTFATHDARMWRELPAVTGAQTELLLGVLPEEARRLRAAGTAVRLYVPFGTDWEGYLAKRVADAEEARDAGARARHQEGGAS